MQYRRQCSNYFIFAKTDKLNLKEGAGSVPFKLWLVGSEEFCPCLVLTHCRDLFSVWSMTIALTVKNLVCFGKETLVYF